MPTVEDRLRRAPAPEANAAKDRARRVVMAAPVATRRRRRRWLPVALLAVALVPAGDALAGWLSDLVEPEPIAAPPPQPRLDGLPAPGRVLVTGPSGLWSIAEDGSRRRIGDYGDAAWSPRGLFIAAAHGDRLDAIDVDGREHWSVQAGGVVTDPVWAPSGYRVAYRAADSLRVVAGDGSGDRTFTTRVAPVAPAWRPDAAEHVLAFARPSGAVEVWSVDDARRLRRIPPDGPVAALLWQGRKLTVVRRADAAAVMGGRVWVARGSTVYAGGSARLKTAGPVSDLVPSPDGRRLIVASAAAGAWVFLPDGPRRSMTAAVVDGFTGVAGWETEPLAVAAMGDGRQISITRLHEGRCLTISGLDAFDRQCVYAPTDRRPVLSAPLLTGPVAQKSATAPVEVYGEVSDAVERVEITYVLDGAAAAQEAVLLEPDGFGVFVAELPARARNPIATAFDADGRELARDGFARMHPHVFIAAELPRYDEPVP